MTIASPPSRLSPRGASASSGAGAGGATAEEQQRRWSSSGASASSGEGRGAAAALEEPRASRARCASRGRRRESERRRGLHAGRGPSRSDSSQASAQGVAPHATRRPGAFGWRVSQIGSGTSGLSPRQVQEIHVHESATSQRPGDDTVAVGTAWLMSQLWARPPQFIIIDGTARADSGDVDEQDPEATRHASAAATRLREALGPHLLGAGDQGEAHEPALPDAGAAQEAGAARSPQPARRPAAAAEAAARSLEEATCGSGDPPVDQGGNKGSLDPAAPPPATAAAGRPRARPVRTRRPPSQQPRA